MIDLQRRVIVGETESGYDPRFSNGGYLIFHRVNQHVVLATVALLTQRRMCKLGEL